MKIERSFRVNEVIDVELPFYFKHDVGGDHSDSAIFGRIEEKRVVKLQRTSSYVNREKSWELTVETFNSPKWFGGYLTDAEFRSSEAEFLEVLGDFRTFQDEEIVKKSSFVFGS